MKNSKVLLGVLAGVTAGALLGILLAPEKGARTKRKMMNKGELEKNFDVKKKQVESLISSVENIYEEGKKVVLKNL